MQPPRAGTTGWKEVNTQGHWGFLGYAAGAPGVPGQCPHPAFLPGLGLVAGKGQGMGRDGCGGTRHTKQGQQRGSMWEGRALEGSCEKG